MKSLKKLSFLAVMCLSLIFVACGKPSEKDLTEHLNGTIQEIAGFDYDYGDVSKTGTKEQFDATSKADKQKMYNELTATGAKFTQDQKDKIYNAAVDSIKKVKYEIKCDEIKNDTSNFTITSNPIDTAALGKQIQAKYNAYIANNSKAPLSEDLMNIMIECYNNAPTKDSTTKVVFEKKDNTWSITTSPDELTKAVVN